MNTTSLPPNFLDALFNEAILKVQRQKPKPADGIGFADFCKAFHPAYQPTAYGSAIEAVLTQTADYAFSGGKSGISRLIMEMPPRHGKTLRVSRLFPAWLLSRDPSLKIITASYGTSLAYSNSRAVRSTIASPAYQSRFPHTRLSSRGLAHWMTTGQGEFVAVGVGSGVAGQGARVIIVDDPTKGRAESESAIMRHRLIEWFNNDLLTRGEEPGFVIIVMATRWHHDDLPGYLTSGEDADEWHVLSLPALAEENDPLNRQPGEALWSERYSAAWLEKRRRDMGDYAFSALYQQRPIPRDNGLFDTAPIQIVDFAPQIKRAVRFYDLAVSARKTADYTAGVKLGETPDGRLVVLDVYRRQANPVDTAEAIVRNALLDGQSVPIRLEADNSARVQLDYLLRDERLRAFTIDAKSPEGDKYTRAAPVASRVSAGQLLLVKAEWNRAFIDELGVFPAGAAGAHDDQVDAFSGAYAMLTSTGQQRVLFMKTSFPWRPAIKKAVPSS